MTLAVVVVIGACTGDDDPADGTVITAPTTSSPEDSASTTAASVTTTTASTVEAEVEAAFRDFVEAFVSILGDPDPADPLIDQWFAGDAKSSILDSVSRFIVEGKAVRRPEDPANFVLASVDVSELAVPKAVVESCLIDGLVVYERETGAAVNDAVVSRLQRHSLELTDGQWRVIRSDTLTSVEGGDGC